MPLYGFLLTTLAARPEFGDRRQGLRQGNTPPSMAWTSCSVICLRIEALVGTGLAFREEGSIAESGERNKRRWGGGRGFGKFFLRRFSGRPDQPKRHDTHGPASGRKSISSAGRPV